MDGQETRGVVPGGAIAGVGDACQAIADHLVADGRLRPSVWLRRGGRLSRAATGAGASGARPAVGLEGDSAGEPVTAPELVMPEAWSPGAVVRRAFDEAAELVVPDLAAARAARPGEAPPAETATAQICIPLTCAGRAIGVLDVKVHGPIAAGDVDAVRRAAARLSARIARLGGPPRESAAQRLLGHVGRLASLEDPDALATAVVAAAVDLTALDSAMLARRAASGGLEPWRAAGPLGERLAAIPPRTLEAVARRGDGSVRGASAALGGSDGEDLDGLRAAGARTLVALRLTSQGESQGLLLVGAARPVTISGDDGEALELLATHASNSLRTASLVRSLRERAASDPLTGLGHHATFHEALAASHRRPSTALVLCDIDDFKRLNDTFGHQHGDGVLRGVACALSRAVRRGDRLFRIGGDEFAALVSVSGEEEALDVGLRLRQAVEDAALGVTVSIGIAVPSDGEADAALLARADRALYRVKGSGRDGVEVAARASVPAAPVR